MKIFTLLFVIFLAITNVLGQPDVPKADATGINKFNENLRGAPVVLGQIDFNAPGSGTVIVHFDGLCIPSSGDRIVLAASDDTNWSPNDGAVSVKDTKKPFSHSRSYAVTSGNQTFYAIGQNYVDQGGTGIASVYGTLSIEYIPDTHPVIAKHTGINKTNENLRGAPVNIGELTITAPSDGKVWVHFNGTCNPSPGDRIVLAASDTPNWGSNDGSTSVTSNKSSFSHSRIYNVPAGTHTFYGVGQNYVEMSGSGIASVYGHLVVKFFPDATAGLENYLSSAIHIYPNPAHDFIRIETELNTIIELIDINGKILETIRIENSVSELNISNLTNGIYLLNGKDSEGTQMFSKKFVKQ